MINMKTTTFSLTNLTDTDLANLIATCTSEMEKRKQIRKERRDRWIKDATCAYLRHPNACYARVGETTVVAVYSRYNGLLMGKATPVKGDAFDKDVGIAVAFAKACGERIPDYI
jgi:hypothetical protein